MHRRNQLKLIQQTADTEDLYANHVDAAGVVLERYDRGGLAEGVVGVGDVHDIAPAIHVRAEGGREPDARLRQDAQCVVRVVVMVVLL